MHPNRKKCVDAGLITEADAAKLDVKKFDWSKITQLFALISANLPALEQLFAILFPPAPTP